MCAICPRCFVLFIRLADQGYHEVVKEFLASGHGPTILDAVDKKGNTPLHLAASQDNHEVNTVSIKEGKTGLGSVFPTGPERLTPDSHRLKKQPSSRSICHTGASGDLFARLRGRHRTPQRDRAAPDAQGGILRSRERPRHALGSQR